MSTAFRRVIPIMRIFDVDRAKQFYVDYLGFTVEFEHRFEEGMPLYMGISRDGLVLHLSEHHGDGSPGVTVYVEADGVRALHDELKAKDYAYLRPGIEEDEFGVGLTLLDPFGNRLRVVEPPSP